MAVLLRTFLLTALFGFTLVGKVCAQTNVKISLYSPLSKFKKSTINSSIIIDTIQKQSAKGIHLKLIIRNDSLNRIVIENPVFLAKMRLVNESGKNIMFQQQSNRNQDVHGDEYALYHTFFIDDVVLNNEKYPKDIWNAKQLTLLPHAEIAFSINIRKVWKGQDGRIFPPDRPEKETDAIPVPVGRYKFTMLLGIKQVNGKPVFVNSKNITVKYNN